MATVTVTSPATGAVVATVPAHDAADLRTFIDRARQAQVGWAALPLRERGRHLRQLAHRLACDDEIVKTLVAETGKPRFEAEAIEVLYACELTRFMTGWRGRRALRRERRHAGFFVNKTLLVEHHPHGVVGVIGPANWPLLNNYADAIGALFAGNAVILKPSPLAPLTSLRVATLWAEAGLPADVLQVAVGGNEVGEALVREVDMIYFTGSLAAGRSVARMAADRLIPCVLELGGKGPTIVLPGANLDAAARAVTWSAFTNGGQACIRTERALVAESVADDFARLCTERVRALRQGIAGDADEDVDLGPSGSPAVIARAERQIAEAVAAGARVLVGGARRTDLPGGFLAPTVLDHVTAAMAVAREETFAPILPILRVRDAEHALRIANELQVGLAANVWARSRTEGIRLARQVKAGSVCVDDTLVNYFCVEAPLGGWQGSGLGFRHGPESLRQFVRPKTIVVDHALMGLATRFIAPRIAFPYRGAMTRFFRRFTRWRY